MVLEPVTAKTLSIDGKGAVTRVRAVLERIPDAPGQLHQFSIEVGTDIDPRPLLVEMSHDDWRHFGEPQNLTIVIYPGDRQDLVEAEDFPE